MSTKKLHIKSPENLVFQMFLHVQLVAQLVGTRYALLFRATALLAQLAQSLDITAEYKIKLHYWNTNKQF